MDREGETGCSVEGCLTVRTIARGLCRRHYNRWRRTGSVGDDSDRTCKGCGSSFAPSRTDQLFCSRPCGARAAVRASRGMALVVPRRRVCVWCEDEFEHDDGRRTYCSPQCQQMTRRLQSVRSNFGMTTEEYRRLWLAHGGACGICGGAQTGAKEYLCVDHDHATGKVRGLLCDTCNRGIGLLRDDVETLRAAIKYLEASASA